MNERTEIDAQAVEWFAERMKAKLAKNAHKGGWEDCSILWLLRRMDQERNELKNAMSRCYYGGSVQNAIDECADVANFAMMIADILARREGQGEI